MTKQQQYLCTECGDVFATHYGRCPSCGEYGTVKPYRAPKGGESTAEEALLTGEDLLLAGEGAPWQAQARRIPTTLTELDRVLGGGIMPGSVLLLGGSPGVGKSTLLLQVLHALPTALYVSGEESFSQVMERAERLQLSGIEGRVLSSVSLGDVLTTLEAHCLPLVIIDSIQTLSDGESPLGSLRQLKDATHALLSLAKRTGTAVLLIGHVTKTEAIAGPRVLEHMVDAVLQLESERQSDVRILRAKKNRYGSTMEIGLWRMTGHGMESVTDASTLLEQHRTDAPGVAYSLLRDGMRTLLTEVQALTLKTNFGTPRVVSQGVELSRVHTLIAVITKHTKLPCNVHDVYVNLVAGIRTADPALDLALVAAIISSVHGVRVPAGVLLLGEVGLSGEVRRVPHQAQRVQEAARLGFTRVILGPDTADNTGEYPVPVQTLRHISGLSEVLF